MTIIATNRTLFGILLSKYLDFGTAPVTITAVTELARLYPPADATVLIDGHGMGLLRSFDLVRTLNTGNRSVRAVLLVEFTSDIVLHFARSAGACGVACVRDTPETLREMVVNVHRGDFRMTQMVTPSAHQRLIPLLTPRRLQTYLLVASGYSDEEVARRLNITVSTAETHRSAVFRILKVHSHDELRSQAVCFGIVSPEEIATASPIRRCTRAHGPNPNPIAEPAIAGVA